MAKSNKATYGWDDNSAEEARIAVMGLRCMAAKQKPDSAESVGDGKPSSDAHDITENLGQSKP